MSETIMVPLHLLSITSTNARKDHVADKAMIASLRSQGLLYPLLVKGIEASENYDVVDGARRLTCILKGMEDGTLDVDAWARVPCILSNGHMQSSGLEQSLHANLHMAMHPLDECEAILEIGKQGETAEDIGLRFGQDVRWVEQRVKLANLCDEVKDAFRKGEISLVAAMKFTLGDHAKQRAFLKQHAKHGFATHMIEPAMTDKWVNARHTNFPIEQYQGPLNSDLFGDDIWLLDRKMVAELQDQWAQGEIAGLQARGYDKVEILKTDDWQTLNNHVEVTGRIGKDDRARLKCFLKADANGHIKVYENMASRKAVDDKGKIKPEIHKADTTSPENIKPLLCTELTVTQQEIVNALAASDLYTQVIEGNAVLSQYLIVANQFGGRWTEGPAALNHNGTVRRWERLNKDYPAEQLINGSEITAFGGIPFDGRTNTFENFCKLPQKSREHLCQLAVASMIMPPFGQQVLAKELPELAGKDWLVPGSDFFKRYRTDQLIDYRRRSGDREAGKAVKKKGDHVADCVVAATTPGAFKLGLYPKKIQIPVSGKKRKGGSASKAAPSSALPDET